MTVFLEIRKTMYLETERSSYCIFKRFPDGITWRTKPYPQLVWKKLAR